jgi:hypothetical protein
VTEGRITGFCYLAVFGDYDDAGNLVCYYQIQGGLDTALGNLTFDTGEIPSSGPGDLLGTHSFTGTLTGTSAGCGLPYTIEFSMEISLG